MRQPAEVYPPCVFIQEELDARGWTLADLAHHAVLTMSDVQGVMQGKPLTVPITMGLAEAFGTSAHLWRNLQLAFNDALARELG